MSLLPTSYFFQPNNRLRYHLQDDEPAHHRNVVTTSENRLGSFWKQILTKVAQILRDFWSYFEKLNFLCKHWCHYFWGNFLGEIWLLFSLASSHTGNYLPVQSIISVELISEICLKDLFSFLVINLLYRPFQVVPWQYWARVFSSSCHVYALCICLQPKTKLFIVIIVLKLVV